MKFHNNEPQTPKPHSFWSLHHIFTYLKALSLYLSLLPIYRSRNLSCTSAHWEISSDKSIQSKQPRTLSRAGPSASTFPPPRISAVIIRLDCPLSFRTSFRSIAFLTPSRRPRWSASPSPPDLIRQRNLEKPPVWTLLIPLLISLQSACHSPPPAFLSGRYTNFLSSFRILYPPAQFSSQPTIDLPFDALTTAARVPPYRIRSLAARSFKQEKHLGQQGSRLLSGSL